MVGEFNWCQASLTSPAALAALRDLPNTNPTLHLELTGIAKPPAELENEDLFTQDDELLDYNDENDVPMDVVIHHVMSGGFAQLPAGFTVVEDESIVRNGVAEDAELDVVVDDRPLAARRAKRAEKKSTRYGADWEEH